MRLLILTNILTPYRISFFDKLYEYIIKDKGDFKVIVMARTEPGRSWMYEQYKRTYTELLKGYTPVLPNGYFIHVNWGLKKLIRSFNPDMAVAAGSYTFPSVWRLMFLRKFSSPKYKLLFWSESHMHEEKILGGILIRLREWMRKKCYSQFDGFWSPGRLSDEFIKNYNKQQCVLFRVPNMVEKNFFSQAFIDRSERKQILRKKYGIDEDSFVFLCSARLSPVKGVLEFLKSIEKADSLHGAVLLIVGSGPLEDEIRRWGKQNKAVDLNLTGYKHQDDMLELYTLADCFILPSLSDPNPLSVIEALWAGLPLLLSEHVGNYPETVRHCKNGYVFSYKHPEEIPDFAARILNSSNCWRNTAAEISNKIAQEYFDDEKIIPLLLRDMYEWSHNI